MALAQDTLNTISNQLNTELLSPEPSHSEIRKIVNRIFWFSANQISAQLVAASSPNITQTLQLLHTDNRIPQPLKLDIEGILVRWGRQVYGLGQRKAPRMSLPGTNGLVVGDCWPNWTAMRREGAHGHTGYGIAGKIRYGAYSIVVNGRYRNIDDGNTLWYWGTRPKGGTPSACTNLLRRSIVTRNPVRVIRGVDADALWRPRRGFRYDGLYRVLEEQEERLIPFNYRFRLVRLANQPEIQRNKPDDFTLMSWERHC